MYKHRQSSTKLKKAQKCELTVLLRLLILVQLILDDLRKTHF